MAVSREPTVPGNIRQHQRDLDRLGSAPPGPMSWGPNDGHIRFYGADGKVLFQANSGGASVVSRGSLTSMTGLFDGIRDKNDAQDGVLSDHRAWLVGHGERLDGHDADVKRIDGVNTAQNGRLNDHHEWIGSLGKRMTSAEAVNDAQNGRLNTHQGWIGSLGDRMGDAESTLSSHNGRINTAQSRADSAYSRAGTGISNAATAQARADSAYSRAGTGISDAAAAHARANSAYNLASGRATQSQIQGLSNTIAALRVNITQLTARVAAIEAQIRPLT